MCFREKGHGKFWSMGIIEYQNNVLSDWSIVLNCVWEWNKVVSHNSVLSHNKDFIILKVIESAYLILSRKVPRLLVCVCVFITLTAVGEWSGEKQHGTVERQRTTGYFAGSGILFRLPFNLPFFSLIPQF